MVAVDGVGEESAEGGDVGVKPFGAVGGVGMVAEFTTQMGLKVRMDFAGVMHIADKFGGRRGAKRYGKLLAELPHAIGMGLQSLPLRAILVVGQGMRETLIPRSHLLTPFPTGHPTRRPTSLSGGAQYAHILATPLPLCKCFLIGRRSTT